MTTKTDIVYVVSNGLRTIKRKTLKGAEDAMKKLRLTSRNYVRIDMVYYDEEAHGWKSEEIR